MMMETSDGNPSSVPGAETASIVVEGVIQGFQVQQQCRTYPAIRQQRSDACLPGALQPTKPMEGLHP